MRHGCSREREFTRLANYRGNHDNRTFLPAVDCHPQLIAHAAGVTSALTVYCAAIYFFARLAQALIHISGFGQFMARTVAFTVGWIAFITFAVVLLVRVS